MKKIAFLGIFLTVFALSSNLSAQCPMCKTALNSNLQQKGKPVVGKGINNGILFLLSMPYVLVGAAGFVWYKNNRRKKQNA